MKQSTVIKCFIATTYKSLCRKLIYAHLSRIVYYKTYALFLLESFCKKVCYLESFRLFRSCWAQSSFSNADNDLQYSEFNRFPFLFESPKLWSKSKFVLVLTTLRWDSRNKRSVGWSHICSTTFTFLVFTLTLFIFTFTLFIFTFTFSRLKPHVSHHFHFSIFTFTLFIFTFTFSRLQPNVSHAFNFLLSLSLCSFHFHFQLVMSLIHHQLDIFFHLCCWR